MTKYFKFVAIGPLSLSLSSSILPSVTALADTYDSSVITSNEAVAKALTWIALWYYVEF